MEITWQDVSPFLSAHSKTQQERVEKLLTVISLHFTQRYGEVPSTLWPAFFDVAAAAVERRLARDGRSGIRRQSVGGASVDYDSAVSLAGWLLPGEIAELDTLTGRGGNVRSWRAPAPDSIRYANLSDIPEDDE